jgi:hypothetical protein
VNVNHGDKRTSIRTQRDGAIYEADGSTEGCLGDPANFGVLSGETLGSPHKTNEHDFKYSIPLVDIELKSDVLGQPPGCGLSLVVFLQLQLDSSGVTSAFFAADDAAVVTCDNGEYFGVATFNLCGVPVCSNAVTSVETEQPNVETEQPTVPETRVPDFGRCGKGYHADENGNCVDTNYCLAENGGPGSSGYNAEGHLFCTDKGAPSLSYDALCGTASDDPEVNGRDAQCYALRHTAFLEGGAPDYDVDKPTCQQVDPCIAGVKTCQSLGDNAAICKWDGDFDLCAWTCQCSDGSEGQDPCEPAATTTTEPPSTENPQD